MLALLYWRVRELVMSNTLSAESTAFTNPHTLHHFAKPAKVTETCPKITLETRVKAALQSRDLGDHRARHG